MGGLFSFISNDNSNNLNINEAYTNTPTKPVKENKNQLLTPTNIPVSNSTQNTSNSPFTDE